MWPNCCRKEPFQLSPYSPSNRIFHKRRGEGVGKYIVYKVNRACTLHRYPYGRTVIKETEHWLSDLASASLWCWKLDRLWDAAQYPMIVQIRRNPSLSNNTISWWISDKYFKTTTLIFTSPTYPCPFQFHRQTNQLVDCVQVCPPE